MSSDATPDSFFIAGFGSGKDDITSTVMATAGMPRGSRWSDGPYSIEQWAATHGIKDPALTLALSLDSQNQIVFGCPGDANDGALQYYKPTELADLAKLNISPLGEFEPLGDQFGVFPEKTLPDGLDDALFPANAGPLYAVVDAALVPGLVTRLENEEIKHRCLFTNEAADTLADVAPYLIELPRDADLTRDLFTSTQDEEDWHYYIKDPCLFLHSDAGFDALWAHLRKFTKIQTEDKKWLYLRFWDRSFRSYVTSHPQGPFPRGFFDQITSMVCRLDDNQWSLASSDKPVGAYEWQDFLAEFQRYFRLVQRHRFVARVEAYLSDRHDAQLPNPHLHLLYRQARDRGYETERGIVKQMETLFLLRRENLSEAKLMKHPSLDGVETLSDAGRAGAILDAALDILEMA